MLHAVGKNFALVQRNVGGYKIVELHNFNVQPFFGGKAFNLVHNFGVRACGYANPYRFTGSGCLFFIAAAAKNAQR